MRDHHVSTNLLLNRIFSILEKVRDELKNLIEDYSVIKVLIF